jgi:hypothetical protein
MEEPQLPLPRNPLTHQRHRREVFWQITLPIGAIGIILLVFGILAYPGLTTNEASMWADISLIWLIIPLMLVTLLALTLLSGSVYLTIRLIQILPGQFYRLQRGLLVVAGYIKNLDDKIVQPFLGVQSFSASTRALWRQLRRK